MELHYATVWETVADTVPDELAAVHGDARLSWAQLDDQAARLAHALADRGIGPGTKVALLLHNCIEFLVAQYAVYRHADHSHYIQGLGYQWIGLVGPSSVDEVPGAVRRARESEAGPLRSVVPPPFIHGTGTWLGVFTSWGKGGTVITLPPRSFDAHELWQTVERERASAVIIVGDAFARPMLTALDEARTRGRPYDLESLHTIVSSGALWTADVMRGLLAHADLQLIDSMGSTEGGMGSRRVTRATVDEPARFRPRAGVVLLDEDGIEVAPGSGRAGLIASPARAVGYYKDPDKTAATFRTIGSRTYVVPGDWATVEPDGQLRVLGRGSQCINSGGEKVFPEEVETELAAHPGVEDCTVIGMSHERLGQEVVAVVAPVDGTRPTDAEVRDWVRERLAGYKAPRQVIFVERVQRLPNGKPDYPWARGVAEAAAAGQGSTQGLRSSPTPST